MNEPRTAVASPPAAAERPAQERPPLDARARVLVVEDEHELRHLIVGWLEANGYAAVEAADGDDAIELLQAGLVPDAIVLDLALPRVSGQAFLDWLAARQGPTPPVIVSSGEHDQLRGIDVAGVLAKPYRPDLLLAALERVIHEE